MPVQHRRLRNAPIRLFHIIIGVIGIAQFRAAAGCSSLLYRRVFVGGGGRGGGRIEVQVAALSARHWPFGTLVGVFYRLVLLLFFLHGLTIFGEEMVLTSCKSVPGAVRSCQLSHHPAFFM